MNGQDSFKFLASIRQANYIFWQQASYRVDGVKHIYCRECVPDVGWLINVYDAKRLTDAHGTSEPCEACGTQETRTVFDS